MSSYLLASSLTPADVGRRVVVRCAIPGSRASDVLGELESWTASELSVRRRDGSVEVIGVDALLAGKVVDAHWARDVASGVLERIASDGWPATERVALGSWELRAAAGWTKRANSVLPIGSPGISLDDALTRISAWYDERGLPATIQVPLPLGAALDAELDARGWRAQSPSHVLVADLEILGAAPGGSAAVASASVATSPSAAWTAAHPAPPGAPRGLLACGNDLYASVTDADGAIVGVARAAVVGAWLFVNSLWVAESHRRQGLAETLMQSLTDAVNNTGVRHVFLQVEADNVAAVALYAKQGFTLHHSYVYRIAP